MPCYNILETKQIHSYKLFKIIFNSFNETLQFLYAIRSHNPNPIHNSNLITLCLQKLSMFNKHVQKVKNVKDV